VVATGVTATAAATCADFGIGGVPALGVADPAIGVVTAVAEVLVERDVKNSIHSAVTEDGSL
jgi:hypothetical protein